MRLADVEGAPLTQAHGSVEFVGAHAIAVVEDGDEASRFGPSEGDRDERRFCSNAVIDQVGERRPRRVAEPSTRLDHRACFLWRMPMLVRRQLRSNGITDPVMPESMTRAKRQLRTLIPFD